MSAVDDLLLLSRLKKSPVWAKATDDQKSFFETFFTEHNTFISGPGGVGKSFCINELFKFLEENNNHVAKTASTGIAAVNIGGLTLHSFSGIGLGDKDKEELLRDVLKNGKAKNRISFCRRLFIDEISMIDSSLMNKIDFIFKEIRRSDKPFGGIKMTFSGDFLQLPPVRKGFVNEEQRFAFESEAWQNANIKTCYLTEIVRQDKDSDFVKSLNAIREGDTSLIHVFNDSVEKEFKNISIEPVKLFCVNIDVDSFNRERLAKINAVEKKFYASDYGQDHHLKFLDKNCLAPRVLSLKEGAQVILLANLDTEGGFVNGTVGKITGFENNLPVFERPDGQKIIVDNHEWEIKEQVESEGKTKYKVVASRKQIPLKLGWASTIHKCQGMTLDYASVDFSRAFEYGQVYVALSRVRTLDGLSISNLSERAIKAHPKCVEFYKNLSKKIKESKKKKLKETIDELF